MTDYDEADRQELRVLVVEDEVLIALLIEDYLLDLGHEVIGPATRLKVALQIAVHEHIDLAILDVNLAGETSLPVAVALRNRRIPFLFATAYGRDGLSEEFQDSVVLQKPFSRHELQEAIRKAA